MKKLFLPTLACAVFSIELSAQSLYVPGGTASISNALTVAVIGDNKLPAVNVDAGLHVNNARTRMNFTNIYSDPANSVIIFNGWRKAVANQTTNQLTWGDERLSPGYVGDITFSHSSGDMSFSVSPSTGTVSGFPIQPKDNLVIKSSGMVGIGTSNPSAQLDVKGNVYVEGSTSGQGIKIGSNGTYANYYTGASLLGDGNIGIFSGTGDNSKVSIGSNGTVAAEFANSNLYVANRIETNMMLVRECPTCTFVMGTGTFQLNSSSTTGGRLTVLSNGNIGMGTATPAYPLQVTGQTVIGTTPTKTLNGHTDFALAVNGKLIAKSIFALAPTFWSDNVFHSDYQLSSLAEVENYIQSHGHLKDVPSEKEVMEKGFSIADMDATLLKKVEELTLYMIQLKKDNDQLRAEVETIKKK